MLIRHENTVEGGLIGIWKMEESREDLLKLFPEKQRQRALIYLQRFHSERRTIEWLSIRLMLYFLLHEEKIILNRADGKPYLQDGTHHISISHTLNYAALLLHKTLPVGIDIEVRSERIKKVAEKFISDDEYIDPESKTVHQLLHWSSKESLFKIMDEEGIDFKHHLHIHPFNPETKGIITATETRTALQRNFQIHYEVHPEYVLTWVID